VKDQVPSWVEETVVKLGKVLTAGTSLTSFGNKNDI